MSESLDDVRGELKKLEGPLVSALVARSARPCGAHPVSMATSIEQVYRAGILPALCSTQSKDTGERADLDGSILELLARRLALGVRVADAKARREPGRFAALRRSGDRARILEALTDREAEKVVLARVRETALAVTTPEIAERVVQVFERWIIPATKDAEADHLLSP